MEELRAHEFHAAHRQRDNALPLQERLLLDVTDLLYFGWQADFSAFRWWGAEIIDKRLNTPIRLVWVGYNLVFLISQSIHVIHMRIYFT